MTARCRYRKSWQDSRKDLRREGEVGNAPARDPTPDPPSPAKEPSENARHGTMQGDEWWYGVVWCSDLEDVVQGPPPPTTSPQGPMNRRILCHSCHDTAHI
jgi:hypothetical protein